LQVCQRTFRATRRPRDSGTETVWGESQQMLYVREPEHGPEFRARMKRVLPDREQREAWLMGNGAELVV
jgi:hypothetical protein